MAILICYSVQSFSLSLFGAFILGILDLEFQLSQTLNILKTGALNIVVHHLVVTF